ncbi:MAG: hypothetical protein K6C97_04210, partial [Treponema sp.]|nr:hypothetical protein [Treponema sp.]
IGSLIVLLICAFCFVILPAFTGSDAHQETLPAFGKYKGKEIRYEQGTDYFNYVSQYGQMYQSYGQQIDSSTYYYIFSYAFNATVQKMFYEDAVKSSGYVAPKNKINRQLVTYFSDSNGKYDPKLYHQTDDATKKEIRQGVENGIYTGRYYDDVFGSDSDLVGNEGLYGIKESDAELDFLTSYGKTKRGFNMAAFSMNDYPEEETAKYGKNNSAKFNKFDLSVITVDDKATATNLLKRIENNEITFEDAISEEYSTKAFTNTEGKITNSYQYQVENILSNKEDLVILSNLTTGALSPVIETTDSFSIFKKNADTAAPDFTNKETIDFVASYMKNYESTIIEDYFTAKATDFTNEAMKSDFKTACEALEIENIEIAPFPLNYGSVNITQSVDTSLTGLANADVNENFLTTAFSLNKNEISSPVVMNNYVVVLQYTGDGEAAKTEEEASPVAVSDIENYDTSSADSFVMASEDLENNFANVYFNYLMSN